MASSIDVLSPSRWERTEDHVAEPSLLFRLPAGAIAISSAPFGGGIGRRSWVLNAQVSKHYARDDPSQHLDELRRALGLTPAGVGLLTAAKVDRSTSALDDGVEVVATVGLSFPTWAATTGPRGAVPIPHRDDPADPVALRTAPGERAPGTINIVCWMPQRLAEAALVNAVMTVTEAKAQALGDADVPGTGTATDAVVVACPGTGDAADYGGPRSRWGGPLARAVHSAVDDGARSW